MTGHETYPVGSVVTFCQPRSLTGPVLARHTGDTGEIVNHVHHDGLAITFPSTSSAGPFVVYADELRPATDTVADLHRIRLIRLAIEREDIARTHAQLEQYAGAPTTGAPRVTPNALRR